MLDECQSFSDKRRPSSLRSISGHNLIDQTDSAAKNLEIAFGGLPTQRIGLCSRTIGNDRPLVIMLHFSVQIAGHLSASLAFRFERWVVLGWRTMWSFREHRLPAS